MTSTMAEKINRIQYLIQPTTICIARDVDGYKRPEIIKIIFSSMPDERDKEELKKFLKDKKQPLSVDDYGQFKMLCKGKPEEMKIFISKAEKQFVNKLLFVPDSVVVVWFDDYLCFLCKDDEIVKMLIDFLKYACNFFSSNDDSILVM